MIVSVCAILMALMSIYINHRTMKRMELTEQILEEIIEKKEMAARARKVDRS